MVINNQMGIDVSWHILAKKSFPPIHPYLVPNSTMTCPNLSIYAYVSFRPINSIAQMLGYTSKCMRIYAHNALFQGMCASA